MQLTVVTESLSEAVTLPPLALLFPHLTSPHDSKVCSPTAILDLPVRGFWFDFSNINQRLALGFTQLHHWPARFAKAIARHAISTTSVHPLRIES